MGRTDKRIFGLEFEVTGGSERSPMMVEKTRACTWDDDVRHSEREYQLGMSIFLTGLQYGGLGASTEPAYAMVCRG
jgi:hypothetical protein